MGNCQAAESATVVIQHPANNKIERIYWSVSAHQVMTSNPGHYVALVVRSDTGAQVKQLKLLRPDDTLLIGQVYRLVSFQDVLKEFASKKCVKLRKLLNERGVEVMKGVVICPDPTPTPTPTRNSKSFNSNASSVKMEQEKLVHRLSNSGSSSRVALRKDGGGQWKPALQTIAESGT